MNTGSTFDVDLALGEIVRLDHIQLAMPAGQEEVARSFYCGVLGLIEESKPPHLAARGGVWFRQGELRLHLGVDSDFRAARKAHPALLVRGLAEVAARCHASGFPPVTDLPLEGFDRVYVSDPFGNRIELLELLVESGDDLLQCLRRLEEELHQPQTRHNPVRLNGLLHPDFQEFGRSGRRYDKADVLHEFPPGDQYEPIYADDFKLVEIGTGIALLTYRSAHSDEAGNLHRHTLRSSLWVQTADGWKMRFHQGTPTEAFTKRSG